jgi:hypothetical protein
MDSQRRSLQVVADTGEHPPATGDCANTPSAGVEYIDDRDDWRAQSVIRQWSPEHQLIGALMHMSAHNALPVLELVPDSAVWRPITRQALTVIRTVVAEGRDPDPVVVLRTAETRAAGALTDEPAAEGRAIGDRGSRHHQLALYLADAYSQVVDPRHVRAYTSEVLADAYRRAYKFHGIRMQQMAETNTTRGDLTRYLVVMQDELTRTPRKRGPLHRHRRRYETNTYPPE